MHKVIISSDKNSLFKFLEKDRGHYSYIPIDDCYAIEGFLKKRGCNKIYLRDGLGGIDFTKEYVDFIGDLNHRYNSLSWWANSISYKGSFIFNLCQQIYSYYCLASLFKNRPSDYIVICNSDILKRNIKRYCKKIGIQYNCLNPAASENCLIHIKRCCAGIFYFLLSSLKRKLMVSLYLSRRTKERLRKNESYYVLKTWITKCSFFNGSEYRDLFFGRLPEYLKEENSEFIILGGILNDSDYKYVIEGIKRVEKYLIIPQEYFYKYSDYVKCVFFVLFHRPRIVKPVKFMDLDVTDFVVHSLDMDYEHAEVNKNLMYYYFIKNIARALKIYNFVFTFENQGWEKILIVALRKFIPAAKIVGYAHASIIQSPPSYFLSEKEEDVIPLPDKIITSGAEPKIILNPMGNYDKKVKLKEGCALRFENIFEKDRVPAKKRRGNILVSFSMHIDYSIKLLRFLHNALAGRNGNGYKVILRPHPFSPLSLIVKKCGIELTNNFIVSRNAYFGDDLKESSLFIYIETTTSVEAILKGVPAINIDIKEPINPDPLFKLDSFKWTVSNEDHLCETIECIYNMSENEYRLQYSKALVYLKNYFYPVEDIYLKEFLV